MARLEKFLLAGINPKPFRNFFVSNYRWRGYLFITYDNHSYIFVKMNGFCPLAGCQLRSEHDMILIVDVHHDDIQQEKW